MRKSTIAKIVNSALAAGLGFAMLTHQAQAAPPAEPNFDTSFAIEYSYSCLEGGCHENNTQLVNQHAASFMTHAMVKCNACHGTHGAETVGTEKPNLTGYYPGIGATGYVVGKDRCLACHSTTLNTNGHPSNPGECLSCHAQHEFAAGGPGN